MPNSPSMQDNNKALVRASFDRWANGTGTPFELISPDAEWTIVGSSRLSRRYHPIQSFLEEVIHLFNARLRTPLVPTVGELGLMAAVYDPETGRVLEVLSTDPGLQFYSGNFLVGSLVQKGGRDYKRRDAFTLERQHFPDSLNHANFPSTVLKPGQVYKNTIIYRFSSR